MAWRGCPRSERSILSRPATIVRNPVGWLKDPIWWPVAAQRQSSTRFVLPGRAMTIRDCVAVRSSERGFAEEVLLPDGADGKRDEIGWRIDSARRGGATKDSENGTKRAMMDCGRRDSGASTIPKYSCVARNHRHRGLCMENTFMPFLRHRPRRDFIVPRPSIFRSCSFGWLVVLFYSPRLSHCRRSRGGIIRQFYGNIRVVEGPTTLGRAEGNPTERRRWASGSRRSVAKRKYRQPGAASPWCN